MSRRDWYQDVGSALPDGTQLMMIPFPFLKSQSHNVIDHSIRTLRSSKTIRANRHQSAFPVWSLSPTSRSVPNSAVRLPDANSVMVAY